MAVANLRCEAVRRTCGDMDLNRMVKCQAGDDGTARRMAQREAGESVRFLHVAIEIMTHLRLGDVAASDESNAWLRPCSLRCPGCPWSTGTSWPFPLGLAGTPFDPPEFVQHVPSDLLRRMFQATLADLPGHLAEARRMRDGTFTYLGSSAEAIISLIGSRRDRATRRQRWPEPWSQAGALV